MADEIEPFATVDDLKERWPDFPTGGEGHATVLLLDASQFILDECPTAADASVLTLKRIACAVVRRAMNADAADMAGYDSYQQGAGPFQETIKLRNPDGDLYLTRQERKSLGCGRQRAFSIDLLAGHDG